MDPMQQPGQGIPQQPIPANPVPTPTTSLEDFIRQSAVSPQQEPQIQSTPVEQFQPQAKVNTSFDQNLFGMGVPPVTPAATVNVKVESPQVVEKIVYKKQRVHGFFRTLTIIALVVIGFLMLLQALGVFTLSIDGVNLSLVYPIFIIFSSIVIWSYRGIFGKIFGLLLFLVVVGGFFIIWVYTSLNPSTKTKFGWYVLYPMVSWASYSKVYITTLVSNLTIQGKQTSNLVEWNYGSDRNLLVQTWSTPDGHDYLILNEDTNLNLLQNYYSNVSLGINSIQSTHLYFKTLFSSGKIDLSNMNWWSAKIYSAGTLLDLTLGSKVRKNATIDIQSALGDVTLRLPKSLGVKLHYSHLVGQLELVNFEQKEKGNFESTNLASAQSVVDITIKFGAGRCKVIWVD